MSGAQSVLRVERGQAGPRELAALAAVLCAVLAARADGVRHHDGRGAAPPLPSWCRGERAAAHRPPGAWR
ncbi:acyl-CoA carboxylase epsilon subunit [Streptomyces sp. NPDC101776]|uniref:acyl-CoA carboxylase epsilon subunit n=1 Tax=Streptomyces sp. NPDC101776 TaxID=3366146 RepID=UPI003817174E